MRKKEIKKEMEKAITLWKNEGKEGKTYFKGVDCNNKNVIAFLRNDKKNEKQPDINIYSYKDKKVGEEVCSLWINESKTGTTYLSGFTAEKEKVFGFINDKAKDKIPYINIYFREE